ncbi:MAG: hypothetical protein K2Y37_26885 [Pirellulales bacterium]|nr:hypothetical protein [Pirellulales bacterium]
MTDERFPKGWNADRAKRVATYYEGLSDEEQVAEDEAAARDAVGQAVVVVPEELLPVIRQLIASHQAG